MVRIRVQAAPFDAGEELRAFAAAGGGAGAIVSFTGLVRDDMRGREGLVALEIEHYPAMTARALEQHATRARARFDLIDVLVIHRFGRLGAGDPIMMVATSARHRQRAFQGAEYLMDWLKSAAPFWKKEIGADGRAAWVEARESDEKALARWQEVTGAE